MPCTLDGVAQEHVAKLLGVFVSDTLSFEDHVNFMLTACSQRIYLMKLLTSQGLPPKHAADCIYCPDTLTHYICYLSLGWPSHQSAKAAINAFLKRARMSGFTETLYCIEDLLEKSDTRLLRVYAHCLYPILPAGNNESCQLLLRKREHTFTLPYCTYNLYKNSFVSRCLFKFV